ncbi:hypothetical protein [Williamsoniiplasma lucivorax]|uniref:hypothetical protein n=1 Tax=Williamsoniiplasma lucivorax TaxID=209274 RepID=UPI0012EBD547|nr:hypothetical protein [Williamsoniiplasma lucivorax]
MSLTKLINREEDEEALFNANQDYHFWSPITEMQKQNFNKKRISSFFDIGQNMFF